MSVEPGAIGPIIEQASPSQIAAWLGADSGSCPVMLDVREPWEFQTCRIDGSVHIPMRDLPARVDEIDSDRPIVCICHHGIRSMQVAVFLAYRGFREIYNLQGGIDAWSKQIDPSIPTY